MQQRVFNNKSLFEWLNHAVYQNTMLIKTKKSELVSSMTHTYRGKGLRNLKKYFIYLSFFKCLSPLPP